MMRRCLLAASTTIAAGRSNAAASASSRLWTSSWLSPSSSSSAFGVQVTSAINYRFFSSSSSTSSVERSTSEREKERERRASPPPVDYEDEDYEDGYAPPYPAEDLVPGPRMLKLIVTELEKQGLTFILPVCDEDSMTALAEPLRRLVNIGVQPTFVVDACVKRPDLFRALTRNGEKAWAALELLVENCEITYEDAIRIFASYGEELLATTAEEIQARVDVLNSCGFGSGKEVGRVIRTCPALLFASDAEHMIGIVDAMHSFFSRKELTTVVRLAPQVLLRSIEEVEEKWEYIFYRMYLESTAFVDCSTWSDKSLEEIATRHEFLLRTGKFTQPDPKKPQIEKENPNLHAILDSDSVNFATQVAGVTTEEWMVFQALRDKGDPDFEKVKPSMRKRLERERKKQREDLDDNVFDTSIDRAGRH